jgi:hypothetical protein
MRMFSRFSVLFIMVLVFAFGLAVSASAATFIDLGAADSFAVLGASTVTSTGPTVLGGNLGVSPGTNISGFPPGVVVSPGTIHAADLLASQAQAAVTTAFLAAAAQPIDVNLGATLGGLTLTPGVYTFNSSALLTGNLTLDALGNQNAVFVFLIPTTITTASNSTVTMINGAQPGNVFWQVGSSATLGTGSTFSGNIMAQASITITTGAALNGRALARTGAVTLDENLIKIVPLAEQPAPVNPAPATGSDLPYTGETAAGQNPLPWLVVLLAGILAVSVILVSRVRAGKM